MIPNNNPALNNLEQNQILNDNENLFEPIQAYGPLELNLLERVENGLNEIPDYENTEEDISINEKMKGKYKGPKEIIYVTGWIDIDSIYNSYIFEFISKIFLGFSILFSIFFCEQNFYPVAFTFCFINSCHFFKNIFLLIYYKNSDFKIKFIFLIELHFSLSYFIYFLGYYLVFLNFITTQYFFLFAVPYTILTILLFLTNSESNTYLSQKKFAIFESIQLILISLKFSQISYINWNYTLILFMAAAIYLTVLGMLMTIILSCSIFGFLYNNLIRWKLNSLLWMTWYYLFTGLIYIYLIKGCIQFYNEDDLYDHNVVENFLSFKSDSFEILVITSVLMVFFCFVNLLMHFFWKNDIKNFLKKVIYRDEIRKEISLRFLTKNFVFPLVQISEYFFKKRLVEKNESFTEAKKNVDINDIKINKEIGDDFKTGVKSGIGAKIGEKKEICAICYEDTPNILFGPCNHGGMCKECLVNNLKHNKKEKVCPFCKQKIQKIFLMSYDQEKKQHFVKGEIKFKN